MKQGDRPGPVHNSGKMNQTSGHRRVNVEVQSLIKLYLHITLLTWRDYFSQCFHEITFCPDTPCIHVNRQSVILSPC